jgi:Ser/Thr protein kinase RdoA (MazF antagonist)
VNRAELIKNYEEAILLHAKQQFNLDPESLSQFEPYEGCANLVYECAQRQQQIILRVSFRKDRSYDQILAEVDFIQYLAENSVLVSVPLPSKDGNYVETVSLDDQTVCLVCFLKGRGMRVPDNSYRYRDDAPIEEYFQNWGATLGKMHRLSMFYHSPSLAIQRPEWFDLHAEKFDLDRMIPDSLPFVKQRLEQLLREVRRLPRDKMGFGLIHGDFNDGNFTVDYSNGDITVFDFDDCCYFWFVYELAAAWEGGIGRVMFQGLQKRRSFMASYMDHVLQGYQRENILSDQWLEKIPLFIKLIQAEEFLHYVRYFPAEDPEMRSHLRYLIACIERDLPYMGFFESIYSHKKPFLIEEN